MLISHHTGQCEWNRQQSAVESVDNSNKVTHHDLMYTMQGLAVYAGMRVTIKDK